MADDLQEMLADVVGRNTPIVLSLPSAGLLRSHKSRFLGATDEGIIVQTVPAEIELIKDLIASNRPCGVAFRVGTDKFGFTAPILAIIPQWSFNADATPVDVVLLKRPEVIKSIQRRTAYRVAVRPDSDMALRVWRMNPRATVRDVPLAAQEITTHIRDLSIGGTGVKFIGKNGEPPRVSPEDRLRVQLTCGSSVFLLEGKMRNHFQNPSPDVMITGIAWKDLEREIETRQTLAELTRLVGLLQREEARRARLGLTG